MTYVRYQSPAPNARGAFVGVFGLVNGLARQGLLTLEEEQFRRAKSDWYNAAYTDPSTVDPTVYDRAVNPLAASWFRVGPADWLMELPPGYLQILRNHQVPCVAVRSQDPGRVIYSDDHQVVVVPWTGRTPRCALTSSAICRSHWNATPAFARQRFDLLENRSLATQALGTQALTDADERTGAENYADTKKH